MSAKEDVFKPLQSAVSGITPANDGWQQKARRQAPEAAEAVLVNYAAPDPTHDQVLQLVQRIFLAPATSIPRRVMFCGVDSNNSSNVVAGVGRALAKQTGATVCLVDANVEHAPLSKIFDLERNSSNHAKVIAWREHCTYVGKNLFLAGTGVLGQAGKLSSSREMRDRILALSSSFEYLLFDAPAVNTTAESALLGQVAGSAILVIEANATRRSAARKAKERLEMAHVQILGTILHNA